MTPVTTQRRGAHRIEARRRQGTGHGAAQSPTLFDAAPGEAAVRVDSGHRPADQPVTAGSGETLDRLVVSSWQRLASHADAACLLCGGTMEPSYGAHAMPIGGRCRDCRTTLY